MDQPLVLVESVAQLGTLTPDVEAQARQDYIADIRKYAKVDVSPDDLHIRGARVCNTQTSAFFGAFTPESISEVPPLLAGKPLLIGHDYSKAPIGRFFAAKRMFMQPTPKTPRSESYWVEALFYTIKGDPEGDAIARRVDLGVWTELSLGWSVTSLPCRLCGNDVRGLMAASAGDGFCPHMPGEVYEAGMCVFDFVGITEVYEASSVFAGAAKGTHYFTTNTQESRVAASANSGLVVNKITKAARPEGGLDEFFTAKGGKNPNRPMRNRVATVVASRDRFDTQAEAADWVRWHQFRTDNAESDGGAFRFHQFKPPATKPLSVKLGQGVTAVVHESEEGDQAASLDSLF